MFFVCLFSILLFQCYGINGKQNTLNKTQHFVLYHKVKSGSIYIDVTFVRKATDNNSQYYLQMKK